MKITDTLRDAALDLWDEAAEKPFIKAMAKGTLDEGLFRNYMVQDYLYLLDYIETLRLMLEYTKSDDLRGFILGTIAETEKETYRVHLPQMKALGVSDEDISESVLLPVIVEYNDYMRTQLREKGLIAGLAALLQCSWVYAYIARHIQTEYAKDLETSPYRSWFEAYSCKEYLDSNQKWIDILDREAAGISSDSLADLAAIFRKCAEYENALWDALMQ